MEAQGIYGARTPQLSHPSSTAWSLCDTGPITDGPAHAAGAQERTKDLLTRGTGGIWTETQQGQAGGTRASLPWGQSFSLEA